MLHAAPALGLQHAQCAHRLQIGHGFRQQHAFGFGTRGAAAQRRYKLVGVA